MYDVNMRCEIASQKCFLLLFIFLFNKKLVEMKFLEGGVKSYLHLTTKYI